MSPFLSAHLSKHTGLLVLNDMCNTIIKHTGLLVLNDTCDTVIKYTAEISVQSAWGSFRTSAGSVVILRYGLVSDCGLTS